MLTHFQNADLFSKNTIFSPKITKISSKILTIFTISTSFQKFTILTSKREVGCFLSVRFLKFPPTPRPYLFHFLDVFRHFKSWFLALIFGCENKNYCKILCPAKCVNRDILPTCVKAHKLRQFIKMRQGMWWFHWNGMKSVMFAFSPNWEKVPTIQPAASHNSSVLE